MAARPGGGNEPGSGVLTSLMGSFGRNLRREREMRGISLDEIAQHTKISTRMLEAIESDRFEQLPGGVFNRSFVLHYARYLGLDETLVGSEFDLAAGTLAAVDVQKVAAQRERADDPAAAVEGAGARSPRRTLRASLAASLLLLALGGYGAWKWQWLGALGSGAATPAPGVAATGGAKAPVAAQTQGAPNPPPAGGGDASNGGTPAAATPSVSSTARLRLQVDTMGPSWVAAFADGKKSWEADLGPKETRTVDADANIRLRVGNAGAVVLTLNGETQPPLGRRGEAKTIQFTHEDLKKQ